MDMSQFVYALYKIVLTFSLTRHTLFPVSPGMCPHSYGGEYFGSIFNISTSERIEKG